MSNHTLRITALAALVGLVVAPGALAQAQESEPETTYVVLDCMKSTSSDYADLESEIWKPIHQELVNQGKKIGWGFYWVLFGDRSECDYYTTNTMTYAQLNDRSGFQDAFARAHPGKDYDEAMARTAASREMVWTQLWLVVDGVPASEFSYLQVNQMFTDDADSYVAMEREIYKPVHAAMAEAGETAGWGLYSLVSPHGASIGYNYGTADFLTSLGGINFPYFMRQVHPEKNAEELGEQMDEVREVVRSDVWMLLDQTAPPGQ